jgi:hypothetical protein
MRCCSACARRMARKAASTDRGPARGSSPFWLLLLLLFPVLLLLLILLASMECGGVSLQVCVCVCAF